MMISFRNCHGQAHVSIMLLSGTLKWRCSPLWKVSLEMCINDESILNGLQVLYYMIRLTRL